MCGKKAKVIWEKEKEKRKSVKVQNKNEKKAIERGGIREIGLNQKLNQKRRKAV